MYFESAVLQFVLNRRFAAQRGHWTCYCPTCVGEPSSVETGLNEDVILRPEGLQQSKVHLEGTFVYRLDAMGEIGDVGVLREGENCEILIKEMGGVSRDT